MENNDVMNLYKQKLKEQFNPNDRPDNCLHCGVGKPYYCESCYQKLVAENLKLQKYKTKLCNMENYLLNLEKTGDIQEDAFIHGLKQFINKFIKDCEGDNING